MLSISSAYEKTHQNHADHTPMISICLRIVRVLVHWALTYKLHAYAHMFSVCIHSVRVCSAYENNDQDKLSILLHFSFFIEKTPTLFRLCFISKILSWFIFTSPWLSKNKLLNFSLSSKKNEWVCWEYADTVFPKNNISEVGIIKHFLVENYSYGTTQISLNGVNSLFWHFSCLGILMPRHHHPGRVPGQVYLGYGFK